MALRAMFNDARKPQAGALIDRNPFANLGIERGKGRKNVQSPNEAQTWAMLDAADDLTPPSFAAYLVTAAWSAARPGELDARDGMTWISRRAPNASASSANGTSRRARSRGLSTTRGGASR